MPSITPSKSTTITRIARVPYLNSAPFFRGLPLGDGFEFVDSVPRQLGILAAAGEVTAGLLPLADYFRLEDTFERIGPFGIAVRGRAQSVLLFSRQPIRQLDGAIIAVTDHTSSSGLLLRLLLEKRYRIIPSGYERRQYAEKRYRNESMSEDRRQDAEADALLLIGDEALRFHHTNRHYPYEIDLGFEWWLWQHLPFVFAVWAVRKDAPAHEKKHLETALIKSLARNSAQLEAIAQEHATSLHVPATELHAYLSNFVYRLSQPEEDAINQFRTLVNEHHLL